jgi:lipopolysaccharide export system protein LptA
VRFTIERIRTLVLVAAGLLLLALVVALTTAKLKNIFVRRDIPLPLPHNIQQEANGYTFVHAFGAHSQYKIHASKEIQLKNEHVELHDVQIELYGSDGSRMDRIVGDVFEFDQKTGIAVAQGPVSMQLTRPSALPAKVDPNDVAHLAAVATEGGSGQIQVKTSGVTFDRATGIVTTGQRVDFAMAQGSGSAMGATYDSQNGYLTLESAVELHTQRGADPVTLHAQHAEFDRNKQTCWLRTATAGFRNGTAHAAQAKILFRADGSAQHLDASGGFALDTAAGGHLAAPTGTMDFDSHSQPSHGHLNGGVSMDAASGDRTEHGTALSADLEFTAQGLLRRAHLEHDVIFNSEEKLAALHTTRSWHSSAADVDFRDTGKGQIELETVHGTGGVTVASLTRRGNEPPATAKMTADEATGVFGPESVLRTLTGTGHAGIDQTTTAGVHQTASGERIEARFAAQAAEKTNHSATGSDVEWAELDGHVALFEQPAPPKPGAQPQQPMHATAGKAVYESGGEWLHLTINPRMTNGGLELTADKVDVSRQSGDALAHGNVKATWSNADAAGKPKPAVPGKNAVALGGNGPTHVIAAEAQLNQATNEATFRGHARLWQQTNSVAAPTIVLNQKQQTLLARSADAAEPVRVVLLNAGETAGGAAHPAAKSSTPSVIRARGGDLWYSGEENRAIMHGSQFSQVIAESGVSTSSSDTVELHLLPAGSRTANSSAESQVDRLTASGHVLLNSQGRRGTGEQLVYSGATGDYVLTGTAAVPPKMTDPVRGSVTGETLIFHSRDDSVSIEGGGRRARTETTVPAKQGK